jgi:hypothetical protein
VAKFNGVEDAFINEHIADAKFDKEVALEQINDDEGKSIESKIGMMNQSVYIKNLVILTVMWSVSGFGYFVVLFLTKHFEGNIFLNFYLDGFAGIIGLLIGLPIYRCCKIRATFILAFSFAWLWLLLLFLFEQGYASTAWIHSFGVPSGDHPEDSPEQREADLRIIIPIIVFVLKIAQAVAAIGLFTASFNEDVIYPHYKRATSIGINNFISRLCQTGAPMVAELDRPAPVIFLLCLYALGAILAIFLPSCQDEVDFKAK